MDQVACRFNYTQVPLRDGDIRIFRLLPSTTTRLPGSVDRIRGEIFTTSIKAPCPFTALSYTWGDGKVMVDIEVNHGLNNITSTLETALRGLRLQDSPLDLWIDQICINQADDQEKGRQIPLMKDIYTLSTQTIGWLGLGTQSSEKAISYLERVGQSLVSFGFKKLTKELQEQLLSTEELESAGLVTVPASARDMKGKIWKMIETEGEWHRLEVLKDLDDFFDRGYFKRGWIKQEVALPPNLIFRCGDLKIDGDVLYAAIRFHTLHWQHASRASREFLKAPMTPEVKSMMDILLEDRPGMSAANTSLVQRAKQHLDMDRSSITLGNILQKFLSKPIYTSGNGGRPMPLFSNDKDLIYGFLGLASDEKTLNIPIQYSEMVSATAVYTDATRRIIEAGNFDLLFLAHRPASHPELPSWVPDFRSLCDAPILTTRTVSSTCPFAAGTGRVPSVRVTSVDEANSRVLVLEGIQVDMITVVGSPWPVDQEGNRAFRRAFSPLFSIQILVTASLEMGRALPNHPLWATEEEWTRRSGAFWRVPIADHEYVGDTRWHTQRATAARSKAGGEEVCRVIERYHRIETLNEPVDVVLPLSEAEERGLEGLEGKELSDRRFELQEAKLKVGDLGTNYASSLSVLETRRGFLGEEGVVGIGPLEMEQGDVICVIFGAQIPVVLRPLGDGVYSYVGEVYCDGIMDGEALAWGWEPKLFNLR